MQQRARGSTRGSIDSAIQIAASLVDHMVHKHLSRIEARNPSNSWSRLELWGAVGCGMVL